MPARIVAAIAIIGAVLAPAGGCVSNTDDSCRLGTAQISIVATVLDAGGTVRAEIDFEEGDRSGLGTPLTLCSDDELQINGTEAIETIRAGRVVYGVTFETDVSRTIEFDLQRKGMSDRVTFEAPLRPAFEITAPLPDEAVPRAQELRLTWDPPQGDGATMRITLGEEIGMGTCIFTESGDHDYKRYGGVDVPDSGMWTVPGGSVMLGPEDTSGTDDADAGDAATATTGATADADEGMTAGDAMTDGATVGDGDTSAGAIGPSATDPGTCSASYSLQRIAPAPYPAGFLPGGYVETIVERSVSFWSIP